MDQLKFSLRKWLIVLAVAGFAIYYLARVATELMWFSQIGYLPVYLKLVATQGGITVVVAAVSFVAAFLSLRRARASSKEAPAEHYIGQSAEDFVDKAMVEEHVDKGILIVSLLIAAVFALSSFDKAMLLLQCGASEAFGVADPVYGKDLSFYVFQLPIYAWAIRWLGSLALIVTVLLGVLYFYESKVFLSARTLRIVPSARNHIAAMVGVVLVLKAAGYYLERYSLLLHDNSSFLGAGYTDLHARLPVLWICAAVCVLGAVATVALARRDFDVKRIGYMLLGIIAFSILGRAVYPAVFQYVVVAPDELSKETPYIERSIQSTRQAFMLDQLDAREYALTDDLTYDGLDKHADTLESVRLWDHRPLLTTYAQKDQLRPYYAFTDVDVDRYRLDGKLTQVMVAPRELYVHGLPAAAQTWVNQNLTYTHGYGIVMSPVSRKTSSGGPIYLWRGVPPEPNEALVGDSMKLTRPGIYFGEFGWPEQSPTQTRSRLPGSSTAPAGGAAPPGVGMVQQGPSGGAAPPGVGMMQQGRSGAAAPQQAAMPKLGWSEFVLVNTSGEGKADEFDYPQAQGDQGTRTSYTGRDGVKIGSWLRKAGFAIRFRDPKILFRQISKESRILVNRHIIVRLQRIMPFLAYDSDPYIMVDADGTLKWIIDAYTHTTRYPYSSPRPLDVYGWNQSTPANYARNSVKVVLDAYDGDPRFYIVDETDPMARAYRTIFPTLFHPASEMPESQREHLRYPRSLFLWQARSLEVYHMTDPSEFYQKSDQWEQPQEVFGTKAIDSAGATGWERVSMEPYFLLLPPPDSEELDFMMVMPMVFSSRPNMAAWLGAWWDQKEGRGRFTADVFPKGQSVFGPMQVENRIDQDPVISQEFTLWSQGGSQVIRGNLLAVPLNGTILWIEPIYIQGTDEPLPGLKKIVVVVGSGEGDEDKSRVVMADTFQEALRLALAPAAGEAKPAQEDKPAETGEAPAVDGGESEPETAAEPSPTPSEPLAEEDLDEVINRLADYLERVEERTREEALRRESDAEEARELRGLLRQLATQ